MADPLQGLIDALARAVQSPRNRRRGRRKPILFVGIADPVVTAFLFGYDFDRYFSDPNYYVEQTLRQKLWKFNTIDDDEVATLDLGAWQGYYPEYTFLGMHVQVDRHGVARIQEDHPLTRAPNLRCLRPVDFKTSGCMPRILRWYDDVRRVAGNRLNVSFNMTWWRGCLDLAIQLRGYENFIADTVERPQFLRDLLRFLVEQRCRWYEQYYAHYGLARSATFIGDDWINVPFISPAIFEDFVLPAYLEIERFHGGVSGIHSCGNQGPVQQSLLRIRSLNTFEVSPWTDLDESLRNLPADKSLGVCAHPTDVVTDGAQVLRRKLATIKRKCAGRPYSVSAGASLVDSRDEYVRHLQRWLAIARQVFHGVRIRGLRPS